MFLTIAHSPLVSSFLLLEQFCRETLLLIIQPKDVHEQKVHCVGLEQLCRILVLAICLLLCNKLIEGEIESGTLRKIVQMVV